MKMLDEDGTVRYESPSITQLYGYDQDDLVGDPVAHYFHPEDREMVLDAFQTIVTTDQHTTESVEYRHKQADGTYLWVESIGSTNATPEGYYIINSRDISAQKQREQELTQANERLGQFARFVSHDLRNPLGIAQGYLELAAEDAPSEHHQTVEDALERMETLIESSLTDTDVSALGVETEPVDLTELSETCWQHVGTTESTLETDIDYPIKADQIRLMQLLENLFRNAIKHNDQHVQISVQELDDGFCIEDNGRGIPAKKRDHVFDTGYTTSSDGTGFGLGIVKHVADAHDWTVAATESSTGGARFEVTGVQSATDE